jgi:hypothetical protein
MLLTTNEAAIFSSTTWTKTYREIGARVLESSSQGFDLLLRELYRRSINRAFMNDIGTDVLELVSQL